MANTKVTSRVLADNAVLTANITDANITTAKIADNAVTGDKVADDVALAGNPTTTTQTAGNNTTRIATTAFVTTAVANIVDSAPSALDTLNELAAALGDDANFSTTITNSIAGKVALSGAGQTIADSGNLTLDAAGDINLDADGEQIRFKDGGTEIGQIDLGSQNFTFRSQVDDKDIIFLGQDGTAEITALTLDMSDAGKATFNDAVIADSFETTAGGTFTTASGNDLNIVYPDTRSLFIKEASTTHVAVDNTGKVGIGIASPAHQLDVRNPSGTDTEAFITVGNSDNSKFLGLYSGRDNNALPTIYVDSTSTALRFAFADDTAFNGFSEKFRITDQGTFGISGVGSGSLAGSIIINNDGETGTIDNAYYNTGLGWEVFDDLTSGDSNTIVGNQAGYKVTSGSMNTLIGRLAGENLTTGASNIAIGYDALGGGTVTGNYNIAIGHETLLAVTSGYENICMGRDSGHDVTTAVQNVAIGHESMTKNQTGTGNVCVGFQAGENASGGGNTMIGYKAGEATEGGVFNVFIGENTRGTHASHSQQIAIGRNIDAAPGQVAIGTSGLGKVYNEFDTDNAWSQGSDERLKQDIKDSTLGLDFINDLRPVTYRWKPSNELPETFPMYDEENQRNTDIVMTGLIAQEVKTAIDTSGVERFGGWGEDNDGIQQIKKELFVFPLINAVKELTAKLEAAEARIKTLEES